MSYKNEIDILVKQGWKLNPDKDKVDLISKELIKNEGHCPSNEPKRIGHDQCPCCAYIEHNTCYCKLYIKDEEIVN